MIVFLHVYEDLFSIVSLCIAAVQCLNTKPLLCWTVWSCIIVIPPKLIDYLFWNSPVHLDLWSHRKQTSSGFLIPHSLARVKRSAVSGSPHLYSDKSRPTALGLATGLPPPVLGLVIGFCSAVWRTRVSLCAQNLSSAGGQGLSENGWEKKSRWLAEARGSEPGAVDSNRNEFNSFPERKHWKSQSKKNRALIMKLFCNYGPRIR